LQLPCPNQGWPEALAANRKAAIVIHDIELYQRLLTLMHLAECARIVKR
jgi:hypothetical protein